VFPRGDRSGRAAALKPQRGSSVNRWITWRDVHMSDNIRLQTQLLKYNLTYPVVRSLFITQIKYLYFSIYLPEGNQRNIITTHRAFHMFRS